MNKRSRHSKARGNLAVNRKWKRNALEIDALAKPCRDHRRAPKREAHAAALAAKVAAREAANAAAAQAPQL
jgi:hypothetical protein